MIMSLVCVTVRISHCISVWKYTGFTLLRGVIVL